MIDRHTATLSVVCTAGMVAGLLIDYRDGRLATLVALCSPSARGLWDTIRLHWNELPAMHTGMILGTLFAVPLGLARTILCYALMLVGMEFGLLLTQQLSVRGGSVTLMVGGMAAGMLVAMFIGCPPLLARRLPEPAGVNGAMNQHTSKCSTTCCPTR